MCVCVCICVCGGGGGCMHVCVLVIVSFNVDTVLNFQCLKIMKKRLSWTHIHMFIFPTLCKIMITPKGCLLEKNLRLRQINLIMSKGGGGGGGGGRGEGRKTAILLFTVVWKTECSNVGYGAHCTSQSRKHALLSCTSAGWPLCSVSVYIHIPFCIYSEVILNA